MLCRSVTNDTRLWNCSNSDWKDSILDGGSTLPISQQSNSGHWKWMSQSNGAVNLEITRREMPSTKTQDLQRRKDLPLLPITGCDPNSRASFWGYFAPLLRITSLRSGGMCACMLPLWCNMPIWVRDSTGVLHRPKPGKATLSGTALFCWVHRTLLLPLFPPPNMPQLSVVACSHWVIWASGVLLKNGCLDHSSKLQQKMANNPTSPKKSIGAAL